MWIDNKRNQVRKFNQSVCILVPLFVFVEFQKINSSKKTQQRNDRVPAKSVQEPLEWEVNASC